MGRTGAEPSAVNNDIDPESNGAAAGTPGCIPVISTELMALTIELESGVDSGNASCGVFPLAMAGVMAVEQDGWMRSAGFGNVL
jgi:hypothetical protein